MTDRWFSPATPVSSTNKTDRHDITEILLKVALNTINQNKPTNNGILQETVCKEVIVRQDIINDKSVRRQDIMNNVVIHKCSQKRHI